MLIILAVGLELGGCDAAYIHHDLKNENFDKAVKDVNDGVFFNSGQCCCGIQRIFVSKEIYNDFLEEFMDQIYVT